MLRLISFGFSAINKLKFHEKTTSLHNFPRGYSHLHKDKIGTGKYEDVKHNLTPFQNYLIETKSMERPFTGMLIDQVAVGFYHCIVCKTRLFTFAHKFNANKGFATFWRAVQNRVKVLDEEVNFDDVNPVRPQFRSQNPDYKRCECAQCQTHLGAVYFDGPAPTFLRYTINSALLKFHDFPDFPDPNILKKQKKKIRKNNPFRKVFIQ